MFKNEFSRLLIKLNFGVTPALGRILTGVAKNLRQLNVPIIALVTLSKFCQSRTTAKLQQILQGDTIEFPER